MVVDLVLSLDPAPTAGVAPNDCGFHGWELKQKMGMVLVLVMGGSNTQHLLMCGVLCCRCERTASHSD